MRVNTVSGSISPATQLSNFWGWMGPNTTTVVSSLDDLLTATAMVPIGTSQTTTYGVHETRVAIDFCYQPTGGGQILPLLGSEYSIFDLSGTRISYAVTSFGRLPVGSYTIGVCGKALNVTSLPVDNTDWVNGYVMVVNAPASSGSTLSSCCVPRPRGPGPRRHPRRGHCP